MNILIVAQEPPLQHSDVVSGNAIRMEQLCSALSEQDHVLQHTWLAGRDTADNHQAASPGPFRNSDELQGIISRCAPDVILVSYWELAGLLPFDLSIPVVLDFVAPRPLEQLFEQPEAVRAGLRRLKLNLQRCDLIMVGNDQQAHLLINPLIEAGFDLRQRVPVIVVPLGARLAGQPRSRPTQAGWQLVSGGVNWPWRRSHHYLQALAAAAADCPAPVHISHFGGSYRWHGEAGTADSNDLDSLAPVVEQRDLLPYDEYSRFLTDRAHIGLELADWNIERAYSQSFRSLEFLRHGLPLMCNRYLPLASLVESHNAGWLVDSPEQAAELLVRITTDAADWAEKSAGAIQLVKEVLRPDRSVRQLLDWLQAPAKAPRLPLELRASEQPPVLGVPPLRQRIRRQLGLARQVILGRWFGRQQAGQGVLLVTRSDLFPADHGAAVRVVETARALGDAGVPVGIVTSEAGHWHRYIDGDFQRLRLPWWVRLTSLPGPLLKLIHYSKDLPHDNSFLYLPMTDGGFFWRILVAGKFLGAGTLQAEFPAYALPCLKARDILGCRVVLVEHNVEYQRMKAQVAELTDAQYRNLRTIELQLCQQADAVVCVSDPDRQKLAEDGVRPGRLHTITHGVRLADYQAPAQAGVRERFQITGDEALLVYHGTFSYPPNREAMQIFADILLPGLQARGLVCHVLAVGREPPASSPHSRIHFTGSVDSVAPWLKAADLAVIPLTEGGGTRMKIIDCFAAGLAVISTPKGIEGIPAVAGTHALITADWEQMMDDIVRLWSDPQARHQLASNGRALAEGLDWSQVAKRYQALYSALV